MDRAGILREAGQAAAKVGNMDIVAFAVQTVQDIMMFSEGSDQARALNPSYPTSCACGDEDLSWFEAGVAGMCNDCFNVGCSAGKPCFWTDETHPTDEEE